MIEIQTDKKGLIEYLEEKFSKPVRVIDDCCNLLYGEYGSLREDFIYIVKPNRNGFEVFDQNQYIYGSYQVI